MNCKNITTGERIKQIRHNKHMTQAEFSEAIGCSRTHPIRNSLTAARVNAHMNLCEMAQHIGVSTSTVLNWENGKAEPTVIQLRKISEISGIPIDFIFVSEKS